MVGKILKSKQYHLLADALERSSTTLSLKEPGSFVVDFPSYINLFRRNPVMLQAKPDILNPRLVGSRGIYCFKLDLFLNQPCSSQLPNILMGRKHCKIVHCGN
ncbi:hypothetical protein JTB14_019254 [Gonioctena quinquepunctata]|nr:hypothetical protein JTB14_019254 [Gonioctena quinquepunctata]